MVPDQVTPENSVAAFLEIADLKRNSTRLIEQVGQHTQELSTLNPVIPRVDLVENQIIRWRRRLPDMANDINDDVDPDVETVDTAIEAREDSKRLRKLRGEGLQKFEK